jgi:DNA-binding MarR family transcriptional regulator
MSETANRRWPRQVGSEIGQNCLQVRIRLLSRTVTRIYDDAFRPHGVTPSQCTLLVTIQALQPVPLTDVAEALSMGISTLSRNARLMESQRWIDIARAAHGNGHLLTLTKTGEEKLRELKPAWVAAQDEATALLGPDGAGLIVALVDALWAPYLTFD